MFLQGYSALGTTGYRAQVVIVAKLAPALPNRQVSWFQYCPQTQEIRRAMFGRLLGPAPDAGTRLKALAAGAVPPGSWRWVVDTLGSAPWVPFVAKGGG